MGDNVEYRLMGDTVEFTQPARYGVADLLRAAANFIEEYVTMVEDVVFDFDVEGENMLTLTVAEWDGPEEG